MLMNLKTVEDHGKYLELSTLIGRSKTQVFWFIRDSVEKVEGLELALFIQGKLDNSNQVHYTGNPNVCYELFQAPTLSL